MSDYPTDEQLDKIKNWPIDSTDDMLKLIEFVRSIWWMPEWGFKLSGRRWEVATGGWSGNEEIIAALKDNWGFWSLCWQQSNRGGSYVFVVPEDFDPLDNIH